MKSETKIIIAEDHKLVRNGYISLLNERNDYCIIGEANDGKELLEILEKKEPDVILLDLSMPIMTGGQALDHYKVLYPKIKTIIVSTHFDDSYITEFFLKGVNGYLSKNCDAEQLYEAIDAVITDSYYFDKKISKSLLSKIIQDKKQKLSLDKLNLTFTELEILRLICDEKTNKQIGEVLGLSEHGIDYHRRSILTKTKQSSAIGLVKYAIKNGIAELS